MIVGIKTKDDRIRQQIRAKAFCLPFMDGAFKVVHVGDVLVDLKTAKELSRVSENDAIALMNPRPYYRTYFMEKAGWTRYNGDLIVVYKKLKRSA